MRTPDGTKQKTGHFAGTDAGTGTNRQRLEAGSRNEESGKPPPSMIPHYHETRGNCSLASSFPQVQ